MAPRDKLVFVTGAAGTLGRRIVRRLRKQNADVRAFVREHDVRAAELRAMGAEIVVGDVRNREDLERAVDGVTDVISAVGVGLARGTNTPMAVDYKGNCSLIDLAVGEEVRHFVLISVMGANYLEQSSIFRAKRWAEQHLKGSGLRHTILRPGGYMNDWRTAWERYGRRGVYPAFGSADKQLGLVSPDDVAELAVRALRTPGMTSRTYDVTNGEPLTPRSVARLLGRVFDTDVTVRTIPLLPLKLVRRPLRPVAPHYADFLGFLIAIGETEFEGEPARIAQDFGVELESYEEFLLATKPDAARANTPQWSP